MKLRLALAAIVIAAFVSKGLCQQNPPNAVNLAFTAPVGTSFSYSMAMGMDIDQTVNGTAVKIAMKFTGGYIFNVVGDSAGWKIVTSTLSKIAMDIDAMGKKTTIDSDDPMPDTSSPTGKAAAIFAEMKGAKFTFTMNAKGEIGQVSGMKEMIVKMLKQKNIEHDALATQALDKALNENSFRQNIQQSFSVYPGKPVNIGDSWSKTIAMKSVGVDMQLFNTYTLYSVVNGIAKVKITSKITAPDGATIQGMAVGMTGDMAGVDGFDLQTGIPINGNIDMNMNMKISAQGQQIPMAMKINMLMEGKKL